MNAVPFIFKLLKIRCLP